MTVDRKSKKFTPRAGVYRITHLPSGRTLLGWSSHAQGMLNRLRFELTTGMGLRPALQRDWNADGPDAFRFEVLDELEPDAGGRVEQADLEALCGLWQERLALPPEQRY